MPIELTAAQRDWISSRAVEMLHTLQCVSDDEVREFFVANMLIAAFIQGRTAANADAVERVLGWPQTATPKAIGA